MISDVLGYSRTRLKAMGKSEWEDALNYQNIPSTRLDSVFHLELGTSSGVSNNQDHQVIQTPFTVRLFKAATANTKSARDSLVALGDSVIADFLAPRNRLTQAGLKNIQFNAMAVEPLDNSNDNGFTLKLDFTALVIIGTR